MKTLKIFSIGILVCLVFSTSSHAQVYVNVNGGMVPYGYYPPAPVYYGVPMGYGYGGGYYNRGYVNPGYYGPRGGGYYRPNCGGYGYGGGYRHGGYHHCR